MSDECPECPDCPGRADPSKGHSWAEIYGIGDVMIRECRICYAQQEGRMVWKDRRRDVVLTGFPPSP